MIGKLIALAVMSTALVASPAKGAPSLSWDEAVAKVAECAGMAPEMAKDLSASMVKHEQLPAEPMTIRENFVVLQPAETKCWVVTGVEYVRFPKNNTPVAMATLVDRTTGARLTYLFAYLGTAENGEHIFLVYLTEDTVGSTAQQKPH